MQFTALLQAQLFNEENFVTVIKQKGQEVKNHFHNTRHQWNTLCHFSVITQAHMHLNLSGDGIMNVVLQQWRWLKQRNPDEWFDSFRDWHQSSVVSRRVSSQNCSCKTPSLQTLNAEWIILKKMLFSILIYHSLDDLRNNTKKVWKELAELMLDINQLSHNV